MSLWVVESQKWWQDDTHIRDIDADECSCFLFWSCSLLVAYGLYIYNFFISSLLLLFLYLLECLFIP